MNPPRFWAHGLDPQSRESAPLTRALLTPFSKLYSWAGQRRIDKTAPYDPGIPVICVGNVTVGGTGKSPVVAALRDWFTAKGIRAASLSRGYKGKLSGPLKVDPEIHTAREVGDEPLMLAMIGESWIGVDRADAGKAMAADGVQLILMDDGFQNPQLYKTHSLLVIDSEAPFGNGYVIPKGPLREPVLRALGRAQSVLMMGGGPVPHGIIATAKPILRARLTPTQKPPRGSLIAFAGIGRPEKVFDSLTANGADISESVPYPDHHTYSTSDLKYLRTLARERDAKLITTEKDLARLSSENREGIMTWPVEAVFEDDAQLTHIFGDILEKLTA